MVVINTFLTVSNTMATKKLSILIVDDLPSNIHLLAETFSEDYDTFIATNGPTALEIAHQTPRPDIILLDIMMPEMNGYEVIQQLKADPATALIPVLFISAIETQESQEYGFSLGAVDYITKPFNPSLVRARVEAHLRVHHLYVDIIRENSILAGKIAQLESDGCDDRNSLFQELFSHTRDGVTLTDTQGNILEINKAFTDITGYTIDEVYGKNSSLLKSNRHDKLFYETMWQELLTRNLWSSELYSKRKNGEVYQTLLSISGIKNKAGDVIYYLALFCDISHLRQAKDQLQELTFYDKLTSLPNRTLFIDRLSQLIQTLKSLNQYASALTLDIDNFREINVIKDVTVGDSIISAIAHTLTTISGEDAVVSHLNADLFAVVFTKFFDTEEDAASYAIQKANEIQNSIKHLSYEYEHDLFKLQASIGVSVIPGVKKHLLASDIIRELESARMESKKSETTKISLFNEAIGTALKTRLELEKELLDAIKEGDFELFMQTQFSKDMKIKGLELLIRWKHATKGYISPFTFIPLAEKNGMILAIDKWVMEESFILYQKFQEKGLDYPISFNISSQQFQRKDFVEDMRNLAERYNYKAGSLILEITEYTMIQDMVDVTKVMQELHTLGFSFAIDDFGTGYSNLHYMQDLPIFELKIDKIFIDKIPADANSMNMVHIMMDMGKRFGYHIVVEGVEQTEQADAIYTINPNAVIQGYLYSMPISQDEWFKKYS